MIRLLHALLLALLALGLQAQTTDYARAMIKSHGREWSADQGWDYVPGLVANAILCWSQHHPDDRYAVQAYNMCKAFADNAIDRAGSFYYFKEGSLDNIAAGKVLLGLYAAEEAKTPGGGSRYKTAADYLYHYLRYQYPRINLAEGRDCFIHKDRYPYQMWLDGLYMGAAFYAGYQAMFDPGDDVAWADIANQFITIHNYTYDEDIHLNYHGWSAKPDDPSSFWARRAAPHRGCSSEFWGRGMGWYFAALADVLESMPADHPDYHWLVEIYQEVAAGLAEWQDPLSGVWYQLLRYDDTYVSAGHHRNYLEASASCMFAYGMLKGLRLGLLEPDVYGEVAEKAYRGVIDTFITEQANGNVDIHQICRSAGLGPASSPQRDGSADYYLDGSDVTVVDNEGKGIGAFIFAGVEWGLRTVEGLADIEPEPVSEIYYNLQGIPVNPATSGPGLYIAPGRKIRK